MVKYIQNLLLPLIGVVLVITGGIKIISAYGDAKILYELDPVIGVSYRLIMILAGITEIPAGVMIIVYRRQLWASLLLFWLSLVITAYRIMFWHADPQEPCPCLGNILDYVGIDNDESHVISMIILIIMLSGSIIGILSNRFVDRYNVILNTGKVNTLR